MAKTKQKIDPRKNPISAKKHTTIWTMKRKEKSFQGKMKLSGQKKNSENTEKFKIKKDFQLAKLRQFRREKTIFFFGCKSVKARFGFFISFLLNSHLLKRKKVFSEMKLNLEQKPLFV